MKRRRDGGEQEQEASSESPASERFSRVPLVGGAAAGAVVLFRLGVSREDLCLETARINCCF